MSRAAQIVWWLEQVEAARRAVAEARAERRRPRRPGALDEDVRARRARVAPLPKTPPAQDIIRGATITGEWDEERALDPGRERGWRRRTWDRASAWRAEPDLRRIRR